MIRILVVDDEKIEGNGIRFLLNRLDISIEMYEAANGVKALQFLKEQQVDVVLTDIKMPFMDGLELIENISKNYPAIKTIIFSGHGEFEYAKKAMLYHVSQYILKPIDPVEFERAIREVLQKLENERLERELKEESIQFFKEHVLLQVLNGMPVDELASKIQKFGSTEFLQQYHCMILVEFDMGFFGRKGDDFRQQLEEKSPVAFQYLNLNQEQGILLFKKETDFDRKAVAESIEREIYAIYQEKCFLAVSEYTESAISLPDTYEVLEKLMENKFYLPESRIFLEKRDGEQEEEQTVEDDLLTKQIRQDIKMKDMVALREHFDSLCEKYRGKTDFSQMYVKFVFSNIMKEICDILPAQNKLEIDKVVDELYRASDFSRVMEILGEGIQQLENVFTVNPQMVHREIETVKNYIYDNYNRELSVDMLAEQVFMAPSYLSHIFKKETGQNLSKFIKALRMEKAREMLTDSHKKIVNISYDVGYPNVSYFCQSFREYFGVSPQKYRNQGEVNEVNKAEI